MREDLLRQELEEMVRNGELPSTNPCDQSITQGNLDIIARITLVFTFPFWRLDPSRIWQTGKHASMGENMLADSRTFEYAGKWVSNLSTKQHSLLAAKCSYMAFITKPAPSTTLRIPCHQPQNRMRSNGVWIMTCRYHNSCRG